MKKNIVKILSFVLISMLITSAAGTGYAALTSEPIPELKSVTRDETVYVSLNADGSVKNAEAVVHLFSKQSGYYNDGSNMKNIVNLTNGLSPSAADGSVRWSFTEPVNHFYYQGELTSYELPFKFSFEYYLNGQKVEDISGATGKLEIKISVESNGACQKAYIENYMCQIQVPIDIEKCGNLTAEGAASVLTGKTCTLSYTVLPGKNAENTITADVNNFSMSSVTITMVAYKLSNALDFDAEKAEDGFNELVNGIDEMREGTLKLAEGAEQAASGLTELSGAAAGLSGGYGELYNGLNSGLTGLGKLSDGSSALVDGVRGVQLGLVQLKTSGNDIKASLAANSDTTRMIEAVTGLAQMIAGSQGLSEQERQAMLAYVKGISDGMAQSGAAAKEAAEGIGAYIDGVARVTDGMPALSAAVEEYTGGINSVYSGLKQVPPSIARLNTGLTQVSSGLSASAAKLPELAAGLNTLAGSQRQIKDGVAGFSDMLSDAMPDSGGNLEIPSFTNGGSVDSVQFVLRTTEFKAQTEKIIAPPYVEPERTFWQKITDLFGKK